MRTPILSVASLLAAVAALGLLALGCAPPLYPDHYTGMDDDDDSAAGDDDDVTGDDDDDTTTGDDDDTSFTCADFCGGAKADCVDWNSIGTSCDAFCAQFVQLSHLTCIETCPAPPPVDVCVCTEDCLEDVLP